MEAADAFVTFVAEPLEVRVPSRGRLECEAVGMPIDRSYSLVLRDMPKDRLLSPHRGCRPDRRMPWTCCGRSEGSSMQLLRKSARVRGECRGWARCHCLVHD